MILERIFYRQIGNHGAGGYRVRRSFKGFIMRPIWSWRLRQAIKIADMARQPDVIKALHKALREYEPMYLETLRGLTNEPSGQMDQTDRDGVYRRIHNNSRVICRGQDSRVSNRYQHLRRGRMLSLTPRVQLRDQVGPGYGALWSTIGKQGDRERVSRPLSPLADRGHADAGATTQQQR